ncbi:hypothetical protein CcaverHIS002_0400570 [Cutaneotrichosporon cavernicola]|uniref:Histone acetyltransferase type B catalytic subunit n=1 Tax=Cutaneotrichosporon cavernicola TaxID=279322 RepID=A0AA48L3E4_9TREE|nr:uncharacterized protein CcaverHIS019_0400540 [Cutaneotrichosporon cavernicola]BEI83453.1 hypothetical protein CcaverHIS002_0400570 [Cutaneotrichosporon cavernicola]BEI91234.1 hypothetical protein CcaverHIS019_0400540 [Cutaneotrichosporon cavernicola]BEI99007.1 hypothetical protein CcaverHIS631_0400500 [Cutaneotrichosporon cavernicola]BEJ06781.1 hypothetical protein CcaverHIS641_0400500 [Cutaneotrichosporon cavernicola]
MSDEDWVTDSNEALELQLVRTEADDALLVGADRVAVEPFHPTFTYPIFGDQEKIFGYRDLSIKLHFASGSLKQFLEISYDEKIESEDTPADNIESELFKFIPPDYTKSSTAFEATVEADAEFTPCGEKIASYTRAAATAKGKGKANGDAALSPDDDNAVVFEVYHTTWDTPGFREYHRRMQVFLLLYIEGGSYIQEDEDAWEFFTLFERRKRAAGGYTYHFVGYTSVYPFWHYPDQIRLRLSQFVILPPYEHVGHGSHLYNALFEYMLGRPDVAELTVEDPAEAFEDLRDRNDLRFLVKEGVPDDPMFLEGVGADKRGSRCAWEAGLRQKYKIAQRQFDRLLEMLLLRQLDRKDPAKVRAYRLQVKSRLFRFNYEMLSTMTPEERKEALAKTYESVVEDYDRLLKMTFH